MFFVPLMLDAMLLFVWGAVLQLTVGGDSEGAILEGVEDDKEYQISLSALYADGARSEAVAIRYSTGESHTYIDKKGDTEIHAHTCRLQ